MLSKNLSKEDVEELETYIPSRRIVDPRDLANFLVDLGNGNSSRVLMNGAVLTIDGGISWMLSDPASPA